MVRRRIRRRRRPRRRGGNLLPFQVTLLYNANSSRIEYVTSGDFNLSDDRPLAIRNYVITTSCSNPVAMQVGFLNGLENVLGPAKTIGTNVSVFRGRMPVALPRDYSADSIRIFSLIFTSPIPAQIVITIKILCKPFGVQQAKAAVLDRTTGSSNFVHTEVDNDLKSIKSDQSMAQDLQPLDS